MKPRNQVLAAKQPRIAKQELLERLQRQNKGMESGKGSRKVCRQCGVPFTGRGKICSTCFEINGNRVLKEKFILVKAREIRFIILLAG